MGKHFPTPLFLFLKKCMLRTIFAPTCFYFFFSILRLLNFRLQLHSHFLNLSFKQQFYSSMNSLVCDQQSIDCSCFQYFPSIKSGLKPTPKPISPSISQERKLTISNKNPDAFINCKKSLKRDMKHKRNYTFIDNQKGVLDISTGNKIEKGQDFICRVVFPCKEGGNTLDMAKMKDEKGERRYDGEKIKILSVETYLQESEKVFSTRTASTDQNIKFNFGNKKVNDFEKTGKKNNDCHLLLQVQNSIKCKQIESIMDDDSDEISEVIGRTIKMDEDKDDQIEGFPTMVEKLPAKKVKNFQKNSPMSFQYKSINKL